MCAWAADTLILMLEVNKEISSLSVYIHLAFALALALQQKGRPLYRHLVTAHKNAVGIRYFQESAISHYVYIILYKAAKCANTTQNRPYVCPFGRSVTSPFILLKEFIPTTAQKKTPQVRMCTNQTLSYMSSNRDGDSHLLLLCFPVVSLSLLNADI